MMRRNGYILTVILLALVTGCTDSSYDGILPDGSSVYTEDDSEHLTVQLAMGTPDDIITRGSGAIDYDIDLPWKDKDIYFYAFLRDMNTSFSTLSAENNRDCLIDGSIDEEGSLLGKRARKNLYDAFINWTGTDRTILYPAGDLPYDFYGYYIDDAEIIGEVERTDYAVRFPVQIDGSQDLMSAKAELTEEQLANTSFDEEETELILSHAYSQYTAQRDIHPTFLFKHHLTRLRFEIYSGLPKGETVYVDSIRVSSRTKCVFTVAHQNGENMGLDFSQFNGYSMLKLTERDGSALQPDTYHPASGSDYSLPVYEREKVEVGGSVLAAPETEYTINLHFKETKESGEVHTHNNELVIRHSSGNFMAGNQYVVRVAVYGLLDVNVTVDLEPWEDGGSIVIDEEEPII